MSSSHHPRDLFRAAMSTHSSQTSSLSDDPAVGLSDPRYGEQRRRLLNLLNRLYNTGVHLDMDIPMIVVIGSQSAGKSSLIEAISGITLPRAGGTCTRVPTECKLSSSDRPWQCIVTLRFLYEPGGQARGQPSLVQFGSIIYDKSEVEDRVRRAQCAVLSPGTYSETFLTGEPAVAREVAFSKNCISLQISGPDVADLSFCDLPGMIASGEDKETIENLVTSYIEKPSCIILLTVACETDWENQRGFEVAQQYDPHGKRTIGVLTKPDRIPAGEEAHWTPYIRNEKRPLEHGWFSVKRPDSQTIQAGITWEEARREENDYFTSTSPWSTLNFEYQQHLGTANVTEKLSNLLSALIAKRLPEIQDELQKLIRTTQEILYTLPKHPSEDASAEIFHLIGEFIKDLGVYLKGAPHADGLLQAIRPHQVVFRKAIRATAPRFRSQTNGPECDGRVHAVDSVRESDGDDAAYIEAATFGFLANEEDAREFGPPKDDTDVISLLDVMKRADEAVTRELPGHYPFVVCEEYIVSTIEQWQDPSLELFEAIQRSLRTGVRTILDKHFDKFSRGGLPQRVVTILADYITQCSKSSHERIMWLLELEKQPTTLHTFYYNDYHDKFDAYYRGSRHTSRHVHGTLMSNLEAYCRIPSLDSEFNKSVSRVISGLRDIGVHCTAMDIPMLLPSDPSLKHALHIMATVRAYFQVAYKRFVDNVPMAIDHELILGLVRGRGLQSALLQGLGITGPHGAQRCREYLREPADVVARREELEKRLERLRSAQTELMNMWL